MNELASLLNTQYDGRYLFAGSRTETAPVDMSAYSNTTSATTADTSYYQGNDELASAKVSTSQSITYGVTADNTAFEQAMRAFSMITNATSSPADSTTLSSALNLATSALDAATGVKPNCRCRPPTWSGRSAISKIIRAMRQWCRLRSRMSMLPQ